MLKKIFSVLCLAVMIVFAANHVASAEGAGKVVIVFDSPTGTFSEPEKVYGLVETSLANILGSAPYEIVPPSATENFVQIYREEHDLIISTGAEEGKAKEAYLKKDDLDNICSHFGGDKLIYIRFTNTAPKTSVGLFSMSQKTNVVLDFRVWSPEKKDFTYMKRVNTKGSSTAIYAGVGSDSRALQKGLKKGLQEIEQDASKIKAAMEG